MDKIYDRYEDVHVRSVVIYTTPDRLFGPKTGLQLKVPSYSFDASTQTDEGYYSCNVDFKPGGASGSYRIVYDGTVYDNVLGDDATFGNAELDADDTYVNNEKYQNDLPFFYEYVGQGHGTLYTRSGGAHTIEVYAVTTVDGPSEDIAYKDPELTKPLSTAELKESFVKGCLVCCGENQFAMVDNNIGAIGAMGPKGLTFVIAVEDETEN